MEKINIIQLRQNRNNWKEVNVDALPDEIRGKYINRKKAVDLYIDGLTPKRITEITGISGGEVIRLVRKCMIYNEYYEQLGYASLIPNKKNNKATGKYVNA